MGTWRDRLGLGRPETAAVAEPDLEVVDGEPWRGWKMLQVVVNDTADGGERVELAPLFAGGVVEPEARAVCQTARHRAPDVGCVCGFNAFTSDRDAVAYAEGHHRTQVATARVELSGTVVEHEKGARGEYQRVLALNWAPVCWGCSGTAGRLARYRSAAGTGPVEVHLGPSCGDCGEQPVTAAEATGMVEVSCRLLEEVATVDRDRVRAGVRRRSLSRAAALGALAVLALGWVGFASRFEGLVPGSDVGQVARDVVAGQPLDPARNQILGEGPVTVVAHVDDGGGCWKLVVDRRSYLAGPVPGPQDGALGECAAAVRLDGPGGGWGSVIDWMRQERR